jgi:hypothetical protein
VGAPNLGLALVELQMTPTEEDNMAQSGRSWKLDRAVVHRNGKARSNRYSPSDGPRPRPHSRKQYWHPGNKRFQRNPFYRPGA